MLAIIEPSTIGGSLHAPPSKSAMQRACAAALVRKGRTVLERPGNSADDLAALRIIQSLGAQVTGDGEKKIITSLGIHPVDPVIHCGESGLSARLFTALAAVSSAPLTITGSGSLVQRPFGFYDNVLPRLGVRCESKNGLLPLAVRGPLQPADITIDGSLSSQFLTGLLFAFSAAHARDITITVADLASRPYIDLTLSIMEHFGLKTPIQTNYTTFYFSDAPAAPHEDVNYRVEGDWSGAAFLLVAGAISGSVTVKGLDLWSTQADRAVLQPLMQCGARMSIESDSITVGKLPLQAFHFNAHHCPDLFPPLAVLGTYCNGTSVIEGVRRLAHKESNRALTLQSELQKMGAQITIQDDLMLIEGGHSLSGADTVAHHDHRIAMACAVAALGASGRVTVQGAEAVDKSYPGFWKDMQDLRGTISLQHN